MKTTKKTKRLSVLEDVIIDTLQKDMLDQQLYSIDDREIDLYLNDEQIGYIKYSANVDSTDRQENFDGTWEGDFIGHLYGIEINIISALNSESLVNINNFLANSIAEKAFDKNFFSL